MLRTIDRYLVIQFIKGFGVWFTCLAGLYVVADGFANLDEFMKFAETGWDLARVMGDYYLFQSVLLFQRISGIVALVTAMFTIHALQSNNELTALLAAGVPPRRVLLPIIVMACGVAAVNVVVREQVVPRFMHKLRRTPQDIDGQKGYPVQPRYDHQTGILLQGDMIYTAQGRMTRPSLILPARLHGSRLMLVAEAAEYLPATAEHPAGFLLLNVQEPNGFGKRSSLTLSTQRPDGSEDIQTVVLTPADHPWLEPEDCFVRSGVTLEDLADGMQWQQLQSTSRLVQTLHNPSLDYGGSTRVLIHARLVQPLADLTLLALGVPFALTGRNRNIFVAIGVCILVTLTFVVVSIAAHWLGTTSLLSPAFSAWLPVLLFAPLAVWLSYQVWR